MVQNRKGNLFEVSYYPISLTYDIKTFLEISDSLQLKLYVIDSSNSFHITIIFDEKKRSYLRLPYKYKEWYKQNWHNYPMLKLTPK